MQLARRGSVLVEPGRAMARLRAGLRSARGVGVESHDRSMHCVVMCVPRASKQSTDVCSLSDRIRDPMFPADSRFPSMMACDPLYVLNASEPPFPSPGATTGNLGCARRCARPTARPSSSRRCSSRSTPARTGSCSAPRWHAYCLLRRLHPNKINDTQG